MENYTKKTKTVSCPVTINEVFGEINFNQIKKFG